MSTPSAKEGLQAAGINSILPKEHGAKFYSLPIIKTYGEKDVSILHLVLLINKRFMYLRH